MKKFFLIPILVFCGCSVGPNYKTPENTVTTTWPEKPEDTTTPLVEWWKVFNDDLLNKYVQAAALYNNDLLTATSNILQAKALRQIVASSFFPQIGVDVNATRTYFSKNGPILAGNDVSGVDSTKTTLPFFLQFPQLQSLYNAVADVKWEIDIWGKTRKEIEAATAYIGMAIEERNDILISLMAEIAKNYIELRSFQKEVKLVEESILLLEIESLLIHKQLEVGYVSRIDDEGIQAMLSSEKAKIPNLKAQISKNIYMLSILTGELPEALSEELHEYKDLPILPKSVAVGLRSDVLRRRPDIRRAERELAAATAEIGVAIASFFPSFVLMGDGGFQSLSLSNLFSGSSKTWSFGGDLNFPIFKGGKLAGNLRAKRAKTEGVAHQYQQTVLKALEETESALIAYTEDLKTIEEKINVKNRYKDIVVLSKERHNCGLVNLISTLNVERKYNYSEQELLASDTKAFLDIIYLYKALGGGWEEPISQEK